MDMKLEQIAVPVSDVDRAKQFYQSLGWRLDIDYVAPDGDFRVIQFTPPGSECSIRIGTGVTTAAPGSLQGLLVVVKDIEAARADLASRGIDVSEVYHDTGVVRRASPKGHVSGPDPQRRSYASFVDFSDPDGNQWLVQEVTQRLPGR
jgi:catechol 2,3-dioxygenase-like lactoylglutathione lyase family enzyme